MRFAYADPPYFGCGKSHYGDHPDGWALSCNPRDLGWLLPAVPDDARVGAWTKTWHQIRPTSTQFAWEPVIWRTERKDPKRSPMTRDWLSCAVTRQRGLKGAKPPQFNRWVLDLLVFQDGDTLDDLFPGTGSMATALASPPLAFPAMERTA